jgi:hypothetical protein
MQMTELINERSMKFKTVLEIRTFDEPYKSSLLAPGKIFAEGRVAFISTDGIIMPAFFS